LPARQCSAAARPTTNREGVDQFTGVQRDEEPESATFLTRWLSRSEAEEGFAKLVKKYERTAPKLAEWMETNVAEGFAVFALPEPHRRRLRTTNAIERLNRELHRRTRVATLFPNEASLLRLVSAMAAEISGEWKTGRIYLNPESE
jgi:transposase-like protein